MKKKRMKKECLHLKTIWRIRRQRFYLWFDSCSFDFRWPQDDWPIENLDLHFIDRLKFNDQESDRSLGPSTFRSALNVQINFSFFFHSPVISICKHKLKCSIWQLHMENWRPFDAFVSFGRLSSETHAKHKCEKNLLLPLCESTHSQSKGNMRQNPVYFELFCH